MHNLNPFDTTEVEQTRQEDNKRQQKDDNPFIDKVEKEVNDPNQVVINKSTPTTLGKHSNQQKSKVDDIDLLDGTSYLYGAGLFHHESPYDCILPQQNVNEKVAPVNAFRKSEEINGSSQSLSDNTFNYQSYKNHRYTTYDVHLKHRDSFLEGSTAYVLPQPQQEEKKEKRQSFFKRISLFGKKRNDLEQKQAASSNPPNKFTRVDVLKKFE
ncbi:2201_t:CDS:2 [Funneliformis caledonium]|uniref:2201_t:CDS:1 n=1 Tax=Funneliformis caledonium TaxID=1117310 RepID=A0A9N9A7J6_9GLOM|nr:2201_t:CDS:2 [Funneliformis caledonium]